MTDLLQRSACFYTTKEQNILVTAALKRGRERGVNNVFKELNLNQSDYVRHANIQFYNRIEGQWIEVNVPGTQVKNYHIFLELLKKYQ